MQKTPPGMNRRRLVEAAAATAAVSTLGLPSLILAEENSSMSAVAQPKGSEKTAIHPFGVQWQERLQSSTVKSQCAGADVIHPAVETSPSDVVTRVARAIKQREVRNERILGLMCLKSTVCDPSSAHGGNTTARRLRLFRSNRTGQSCIICAAPARNGERSTSAAPGSHSTISRLG